MLVRAIVVLLVVGGLALLAASDPVHTAILGLLDVTRVVIQAHPVLGVVAFVGLAALSAVLAFFSSAVLVPVAIHAWGAPVTALLLWVGWLLGGLGAYLLAAWFGRPALHWVAPGESFVRYEAMIRRHGTFGFLLLFQLALPSEIPGYVLGLARAPLPRYLAALALAEVPYAVGTILLGASFLERRYGLLLVLGLLSAVGIVSVARALTRALRTRERSTARPDDPPEAA
jgi:uncharacterized membrane protein YdjX (TVP38/TMEM64 family)